MKFKVGDKVRHLGGGERFCDGTILFVDGDYCKIQWKNPNESRYHNKAVLRIRPANHPQTKLFK